MRLRANFYKIGDGVMADCPEAGVSVRGDTAEEAMSKLKSTLKHRFIDFSIEARDC